MIYSIPIEPIEMRYSIEWNNYFKDCLGSLCKIVPGSILVKGIEKGKFLDITGTNYYKSSQLMNLIDMIHYGRIKDNDVLLFHDLWFPGIEQLFYIRDALNINFKIVGCLHAGAYDPNDFLYQQRMGKWAIHFEHCLFSGADLIFVATDYHKNLLIKSRSLNKNKIKVTGFPLYRPKITANKTREDMVVFPHRLDEEKHPEIFNTMADELFIKNWQWVKTAGADNKKEYFKILGKAKVAVSFASQETWGIAMQEAVLMGCIPVVPDSLSYKEIFPAEFRYRTQFEARDMIIHYMEKSNTPIEKIQKEILQKGSTAITKMKENIYGFIY